MNCPACNCWMSTVQCPSCWSDLQVKSGIVGNKTSLTRQRHVTDLEKQLAAGKAAEKTLDFLKLQVPVKPSTESDVLSGKVTILVQGCDEIPAHRFVLADKSPVFRKMFESEMTESKTGVISIHDASYAGMQAVVKFCYTAEIDFTDDVYADEVFEIAHKYQILHLRDRCEEELCGSIAKENYIDLMRLSRNCEAKQLQEELGKYLRKHFGDVFPVLLEAV